MSWNIGKYNEPICITGKNSEAVLLSLEDYNNLIATMEINSNPVNRRRVEYIVERMFVYMFLVKNFYKI